MLISYVSIQHGTNMHFLSHVGHHSNHSQSSSLYTSMCGMIHDVVRLRNIPRLVTANYSLHTLSNWVYILFPTSLLILNIRFD